MKNFFQKRMLLLLFGMLFSIIVFMPDAEIVLSQSRIPAKVWEWNGHFYAVIHKEKKPEEAQKYCKSMGGYLVTLGSQREQNFVASLAEKGKADDYLIGATDYGDEGNWRWLNGEKWKYFNWYLGGSAGTLEPNNGLGSGEDYAVMNRERNWQWVDVYGGYDDYTVQCSFICEWSDRYVLTVNKKKLSLRSQEVQFLEYSATDLTGKAIRKKAVWKSSDPKVAKVSKQGKVTAVRAGECTVTCKVGNREASIKVVVRK